MVRKYRSRLRIIIIVATFCLLTASVISISFRLVVSGISEEMKRRALLKGEGVARGLHALVEEIVSREGLQHLSGVRPYADRLRSLMDSIIAEDEELLYGLVLDSKGEVIIHSMPERGKFSFDISGGEGISTTPVLREDNVLKNGRQVRVYDVSLPIYVEGEVAGSVHLGFSHRKIAERISIATRAIFLKIAIASALCTIFLSLAMVGLWRVLKRQRILERKASEEDRLAYVGLLSSGLVHELRSPLNVMTVDMRTLQRELEEPHKASKTALRNLTERLSGQMERLTGMLKEFLRFGKPGELKLEETNPNTILRDVLEFLHGDAKRNGIQVIENLDENLLSVRIDRTRMREAIFNIALNAIQAMPHGGTLSVSSTRVDSQVRIELSDTGCGLSEEECQKIFDIFYSTKDGGTGLGLPIVRRTVHDHGGTIEVKSRKGEGTTVTISLPVSAKPLRRVS
ncbi:ATP-binding protein [candidate division NPL-UPA2 bacterium]|nr:ATP-binding protein [candidate division NPL-UPA2 bacterium]